MSSSASKWLFPGVLLIVACSGGSKPPPGKPCLMNSECTSPLSCSFGTCHVTCVEARDCSPGQDCVKSPKGSVCQQPTEKHCDYRSDCQSPLFCAVDRQCRSQCKVDIDCPTSTQKCVAPDMVCAEPGDINPTTHLLKNALATPVPDAPDGGAGDGAAPGDGAITSDGSAGDVKDANTMETGADGGGIVVNSCPTPQTTFPNVFQGTSNASFTSGVAARSGSQVYIFSAYSGPVPTPTDAGADPDAAVVNGNFLYAQTFDVATGLAAGPAASLFQIEENGYEPYFYVQDVAVAPTGEIVLIYGHGTPGHVEQTANFASFFTVGAPQDAGGGGLQLAKTVQIESLNWGSPRATWSAGGQVFVLSWRAFGAGAPRVRKFLRDGSAAGGDTNEVPTVVGFGASFDQGHAGTSRDLVGVTYGTCCTQSNNPYLTVLGADGNQVGDSINLKPSFSFGVQTDWLTVGGTAKGFATFFHSGATATEVFVPTTDTGVVIFPDGGTGTDGGSDAGPDGGVTPAPFASFSFPSTSTTAHAISDDTGGQGGVGLVVLESNGATFIYVTADGSQHVTAGTPLSSSTGAQVAIANYRGSFSISLYDSAKHATQASVSGCKK
ncbi:MAG: hypothetical protein JWM82_825 [Myxococcales bacterium]|nr:hypothetical protein [Myxococcales bacterium]